MKFRIENFSEDEDYINVEASDGKIEFAGNDFQSFCLSRTEIFACSASL